MAESVNAAQLASRKIKSAKGVRGKLGNRVISNTGAPGINGTQPFQGPDASSGGNLFGGGLNAAGTFNFSAPVKGISFGDKPEISSTHWGSDGAADEDRRPDALAGEAERRNKPFRASDSSGDANPQQFGAAFQRTPLSALGQPNGASPVPDATKPNPFQISRSQSPAVVPPFNFGASTPQAQPTSGNIFPFGQNSQPSAGSSTFRFGTPPAVQEKPPITSFSFNQASSQAEHVPSSNSSFGLTTSAPTIKPAGSIFSFGQTSTHAQQPSTSATEFNNPAATVNIFGNSNTSNSMPTLGLFGQPNQQPASSSNNLLNQTSMANPTNGMFGNQSQSAVSSTGLFGIQQPKPASANPFTGVFNQQSVPSGNVFGNTNPAPESASNLFGTFKPQHGSSETIFGAQKEQVPASTQLTTQKEHSTPTSNVFTTNLDNPTSTGQLSGTQNGRSASAGTSFGSETKHPLPTGSLFSTQQPQNISTDSLFGGSKGLETFSGGQPNISSSSFPNASSVSISNIFGKQAPQPNTATNLFASINQPAEEVTKVLTDREAGSGSNESEADSVLPSIEGEGPTVDNAILERLENEASAQRRGGNLFTSTKQIEAPTDPANASLFTNSNVPNDSLSPVKTSPSRTTGSVRGEPFAKGNGLADVQNHKIEIDEISDSVIGHRCPDHFTDAQRAQFFAAYRLRSLNKAIRQYIDRTELSVDFGPLFHHYIDRRGEILEAYDTGLNNLKRKHDEVQGEPDTQQSNPKKRSKPLETSGPIQHIPRKSSPLKTQSVMNNVQSDRGGSPEKLPNPQARRPSMSPTKRAQHSFIGSTTPKAPPPSRPFFQSQQDSTLVSPSPRGKRKAEVQIDKDHPTEEEAIGASHSSKWHPANENKPSSVTSGVFKSILDSAGQSSPGSPEKKMFSLSKTQSSEKPRFNPFAALPMPNDAQLGTSSNTASNTPSNLISNTIPKIANSGSQNETIIPQNGAQATGFVPAKPTSSKSLGASSEKLGAGQILSNPSTSGTSAQLPNPFASNNAPTFGTKSAPAILNPFAPKEGSTASSSSSAKPASASTNMFIVTPKANTTLFNPFAPKATTVTTTSASSSDTEAKVIKPPTFGSAPVNFLAQFGQKSKKSMADAEAEALQKAKDEDMDSDEDETEWEARYMEKRAAEKKATEELAKSKRATFIPGKGFVFDKVQQSSDDGKSAAKSIFSQTSAPASFGSNLFASINRSEASSPGAISSRASSVFDGLGPSKSATFGGHNIFGHLSDVESGADSGKGNDADDDITDDETSNSNDEQDDEKKDTTSDPSEEDIPATESPSTPAEETGPSITTTKKPAAVFNFNPSNSGASTPASGGSLFDRISKDPQGNPIRQMPAESKETTGLGATSIFGSNAGKPFAGFGQMVSADVNKPTQDNTWKPDSPIRFGASTTSPPTVNVTAPTPTKPTNFTGLFGSNAPPTPTGSPFGIFGTDGSAKPSSPASFTGMFGNNAPAKPISGLFAHLSDTKPAPVGFGFGSTAGSSLLPSTAGSTATSRATSPGATTDGESNNENIDPEAEHHEQIDLTTGGPGEENEEVLHQIRAKALKFESSKDTGGKTDWVVKGLGPLRVLKNKETGASRVLLRADPSGTIVLNKGILENATYTATGKTIKLLTAGDGGQGLETWLLQVKMPAGAEELAKVLEDNKRKS